MEHRLFEAKLSFPNIVKPQVACGVAVAHSMVIISSTFTTFECIFLETKKAWQSRICTVAKMFSLAFFSLCVYFSQYSSNINYQSCEFVYEIAAFCVLRSN